MEFKGFETLAEINTSNYDADQDSEVIVLVHVDSGQLMKLMASGCMCCGNKYDGLSVTDAEATDPVALLTELVEDVYPDDRDSLRPLLVELIERYGVQPDLPALP